MTYQINKDGYIKVSLFGNLTMDMGDVVLLINLGEEQHGRPNMQVLDTWSWVALNMHSH